MYGYCTCREGHRGLLTAHHRSVQEVPELLEDGLKRAGGDYSKKGDWEPYAIADGHLILGQNPSSSEQVGELVVKALK